MTATLLRSAARPPTGLDLHDAEDALPEIPAARLVVEGGRTPRRPWLAHQVLGRVRHD